MTQNLTKQNAVKTPLSTDDTQPQKHVFLTETYSIKNFFNILFLFLIGGLIFRFTFLDRSLSYFCFVGVSRSVVVDYHSEMFRGSSPVYFRLSKVINPINVLSPSISNQVKSVYSGKIRNR